MSSKQYTSLPDDVQSSSTHHHHHHHQHHRQPPPSTHRWGRDTQATAAPPGRESESESSNGSLTQFKWGRNGAVATTDRTVLRLAEDDSPSDTSSPDFLHKDGASSSAAVLSSASPEASAATTPGVASRTYHKSSRRRRANSATGGPRADDAAVDGFVPAVATSSSHQVLERGLLDHEEASAAIGVPDHSHHQHHNGRTRAMTTATAAAVSTGDNTTGFAWQRPRSKSAGPASLERADDGIAPRRVHRTTPASAEKKKDLSIENVKKGAWSVACEVLNLFPAAVAEKLVKSVADEHRYRLQELEIALVKPFRREEASHYILLPALWNSFMGVIPTLPAAGVMDTTTYRSELWKDYGFQGVDPGTDFRGSGLLGLRCLIWLCTEEPDLIREMIVAEYPFAIAVINLVMAVMEMLQLTKSRATCLTTKATKPNYTTMESQKRLIEMIVAWRNPPCVALPPPPRGATLASDGIALLEDGFCAAVSIFCRILHAEWQRSPRNVLDFNGVLRVARHKFEAIFRDKETYDRIVATLESRYPELPPVSAGL